MISMMLRSSLTRIIYRQNALTCAKRSIRSAASNNTTADTVLVSETSMPPLETAEQVYAPKIVRIVDEISHLTVLEVSELNKLLKKTLNISDTPMMTSIAAPTGDSATEDDAPVVKEQTEFTVRLNSFAADSKIKVIKAVKSLMPDMNLVKAKSFVESLPQVVKKDVPKEEADEALKILQESGATVVVD